MKRNLLLLLASSFLLAGCNPSITFEGKMTLSKDEPTVIEGKMNVEPKAVQGPENADVITYLVLTKVGKYSGNQQVKAKDDNLFLENFIEFKGKPGDPLPGATEITASSGAKFLSWVAYENTGALTYFDKVPNIADQIYYAYFESNPGTPGPVDPVDPGEGITITITGVPEWITNDGCVVFAWAWGGGNNGAWYKCEYGAGDKPTTFSFVVPAGTTGCLLARCAANTITPDWQKKDDGPGKVYNQSKDITIVSGTTSYPWVEKK